MEIINKFDNAFAASRPTPGTPDVRQHPEPGRDRALLGHALVRQRGRARARRQQTTSGRPSRDAIFGATFGMSPLTAGDRAAVPGRSALQLLGLATSASTSSPDDEQGHDQSTPTTSASTRAARCCRSSRPSATPASSRRTPGRRRTPRSASSTRAASSRPYAGASTSFVKKYRELQAARNPRWKTAAGYGADANGLGRQGPPRPDAANNPVTYPFKSFDGSVTFNRQQSGERTFDINEEGVAHYGLYADWFEDLRKIGGDAILEDMSLGADSYFRTWERAVGITPETCRDGRLRLTSRGMGLIEVGVTANKLLRDAGQPTTRKGRSWRWCVEDRGNEGQLVRTAFTPEGTVGLVGSAVRRHRIDGVGAGAKASRIKGARSFGRGIRVRDAGSGRKYVFGVSRGRVRWVALAMPEATRSRAALRSYTRIAGLT
jgi:hypothetical protein